MAETTPIPPNEPNSADDSLPQPVDSDQWMRSVEKQLTRHGDLLEKMIPVLEVEAPEENEETMKTPASQAPTPPLAPEVTPAEDVVPPEPKRPTFLARRSR